MERESVVSSVLSEVGYDPSARTLEVLFQSGAIYLYYFVPEDVYRGLMSAASLGGYFNREIKRVYEHKRIAGPYEPAKPRPRSGVASRRRPRKRR